MARKFGPRQLKRESAPSFWPIHRKEATWAPKTRPGPHPQARSVPLSVLIRDMMRWVDSGNEAARIVHDSKVKVDGKTRRDHRFSIGLMDVVQFPSIGKAFRLLPKPRRGLSLLPISEGEVGYKLCKITGKKLLSGGKVQLNLHDGRNMMLDAKTAGKYEESIEVGGALQIQLPSQRVINYVPFKTGNLALVTDGRNEGFFGRIASVSPGTQSRPKIARIETESESFETPIQYIIPVGTDTSLVSLEK
jgi:small subunit ribosomal protein S4e